MRTLRDTLLLNGQSFLKVFRFNKMIVAGSILISCLLAMLSNALIVLSKWTIDSLAAASFSMFIWFAGLTVAVHAMKFIFVSISQYGNKLLGESYSVKAESELIDFVNRKALLEKEHPGFRARLNILRSCLSKYFESYTAIIQFIEISFAAVISMIIIMSKVWLIGIVIIVLSLVKGYFDFSMIKKRIRHDETVHRKNVFSNYYLGLLTNNEFQKELMLFQAVNFFKNRLLNVKKEVLSLDMGMERATIKVSIIGQLCSIISLGFTMLYVAYQIYNKQLTVGDFVAITMAASLAETNMHIMQYSITRLVESAKYIRMLRDEEDKASEQLEQQAVLQGNTDFIFENEIRLSNLAFTYPNRMVPAVKHISASIKKGDKIVILGSNGSGKTTLIKLLLGLYPVKKNMITVDGVSLDQIVPSKIWSRSTMLFQDYIPYMTTIRENIAVGKLEDVDNDERINEMLRRVGFDIGKDFPKGLDTNLGYLSDESVNLSGGQWQRLALARAFFRDSELIILDEPTSALDPISEVNLLESIMDDYKDKTIIIVSHRVGIAKRADQILYMKDGEIKEMGTHSGLIERRGDYFGMWSKQVEWYS